MEERERERGREGGKERKSSLRSVFVVAGSLSYLTSSIDLFGKKCPSPEVGEGHARKRYDVSAGGRAFFEPRGESLGAPHDERQSRSSFLELREEEAGEARRIHFPPSLVEADLVETGGWRVRGASGGNGAVWGHGDAGESWGGGR